MRIISSIISPEVDADADGGYGFKYMHVLKGLAKGYAMPVATLTLSHNSCILKQRHIYHRMMRTSAGTLCILNVQRLLLDGSHDSRALMCTMFCLFCFPCCFTIIWQQHRKHILLFTIYELKLFHSKAFLHHHHSLSNKPMDRYNHLYTREKNTGSVSTCTMEMFCLTVCHLPRYPFRKIKYICCGLWLDCYHLVRWIYLNDIRCAWLITAVIVFIGYASYHASMQPCSAYIWYMHTYNLGTYLR